MVHSVPEHGVVRKSSSLCDLSHLEATRLHGNVVRPALQKATQHLRRNLEGQTTGMFDMMRPHTGVSVY